MTKEYNDSLNRGLVTFILKSVAVILAVAGILFITGIASINIHETNHVKQTYIDGVLVEETHWDETDNIQAGIKFDISVDESTILWSK